MSQHGLKECIAVPQSNSATPSHPTSKTSGPQVKVLRWRRLKVPILAKELCNVGFCGLWLNRARALQGQRGSQHAGHITLVRSILVRLTSMCDSDVTGCGRTNLCDECATRCAKLHSLPQLLCVTHQRLQATCMWRRDVT